MAATTSALTAALSPEHFLTLFLAQLKNQDPMEPMSNAEMVSQMADIATVEAVNGLKASFQEILLLQEFQNGSSLLGRQVEFDGVDGAQRGTVSSIGTRGEKVELLVDGTAIGLSDVTAILE